jgi:arabinofuranosyltransferase
LYIGLAIAAVVAGAAVAIARAWVCDDAFISYRYAEHLVAGKGMVFNAGERVEGETNLLWTLWTALGLALGAGAIAWTKLWGLACYVAALALLARRGRELGAIPAAAIFGATTIAWAEFATSGLETSAFTLSALGAYYLVSDPGRPPRAGLAGLVIGASALLRPDGIVFGVVIGVWLLAGGAGPRGRQALRAALVFAAGVAIVWIPATIWRVVYYGDLVPNTYYAKSADRAWWSQGAAYVWLFAGRYWPLVLAFPLAVAARRRAAIALELAMAGVYTIYVARVGGDFMFARLLVPVTPFLALALARGLAGALADRPRTHAAAVGVLALALAFMPQAVDGRPPGTHGVVDERLFYTRWYEGWADNADHDGAILARMFDGLPVTIGFIGTEARLVYRSRVATAIECETGLTDRVIARQPLAERGRVGHEKHAHLDYLLGRGVELVFAEHAREILDLDRFLPDIEVDLGGVKAWVVVWNPTIMAALRARGATFVDLPLVIDGVIAALPLIPDDAVQRAYDRLRRSYFDHVDDRAREAPFRARLHLR